MLAESMRGICASGNAPDEISCRCIRCGDNLPSFSLTLLGFLCIIYSCYFRTRIHSRGFVQLGYFSGPWIIRIIFILFAIWKQSASITLFQIWGLPNLACSSPLCFYFVHPYRRWSRDFKPEMEWKTAGYVFLCCLPVFALQLIVILIGPDFNKGKNNTFELPHYFTSTAVPSRMKDGGDDIALCTYPLLNSLALRSLLDLEARRRISDDHNETISLIANQSLLGESMGVSPERNSDASTKRGSISFRTVEKDGTSVDTYVELSLFSPSRHATPPGSPRPLGWPMVPRAQVHGP
ncbi:hypothetical protein CK203_102855 [Vitis vinifera]|uniref:Uncharacterized protein n=1 Tax=Vitis vinifera TaxID=29760 RepID=A0A438D0G4_VITVI|nr:hypothetical protein CK203_102855 [Vitis vinifera]